MFLFILYILLAAVQSQIKTLTKNDLSVSNALVNSEPYLIFIYFAKIDFSCPLCDHFLEQIVNLDFTVKTLNFAENVELSSRFLQHTFPAFIIRYENRSYVIEPSNYTELEEIVKTESWKEEVPIRKILDVNSVFAIVFSKINVIIFAVVQGFYYLNKIVPDSFITAFIMCVIVFLIYSIINVFKTPDPKVKIE